MARKSKAYLAGYEHGKAAGSWVIDGNTDAETCAKIVKGYDEGDCTIMDMMPSPLSGEWAGDSIAELSDRYDVNLSNETKADHFEAGFSEGYWDEVLRAANYQTA